MSEQSHDRRLTVPEIEARLIEHYGYSKAHLWHLSGSTLRSMLADLDKAWHS